MPAAHDAISYLRDVPDSRQLSLNLGGSVRNLRELAEALDLMDKKTFHHHVARGRNDLAEWVGTEIGDKTLAKRMRQSTTQEDMLKAVDDRYIALDTLAARTHATSDEFLSLGAVDFIIGLVIGFIAGIIIATLW